VPNKGPNRGDRSKVRQNQIDMKRVEAYWNKVKLTDEEYAMLQASRRRSSVDACRMPTAKNGRVHTSE